MTSKGRPYRTLVVDGFEILIGRGARENDVLTFEVASPKDHWLHVAGGTPGSHVVIRNPEGCAIPENVLAQAASHAAWFSKARAAPRVDVHHCRVGDVKKPRGAPAGLVRLQRYERLRVRPAAPPQTPAPGDEHE